MPPARQTASQATPASHEIVRRGARSSPEAEHGHESGPRRIEEAPAAAVVLAPIIGLLLWIGLFMLVF